MAEVYKPVIYLEINGQRFHWADNPADPNAVIFEFEFEDTDGTAETDSKKKGIRDELKFKFKDWDEESQSYRSDSSLFTIGNIVRFRWGYEGSLTQLAPEKVMKIVDVTTTFPNEDLEVATITCHDLSKTMNVEDKDILRPKNGRTPDEKSKYTLNSVVEEIANENKLIHINKDPIFDNLTSNKGWQQKKETNIQFLQRLASEYGAEVYVENKSLTFARKGKVVKDRSWGYLHRGLNEQWFELRQQGRRIAQLLSFTPKVNLEDAAHTVEGGDKSTKTNQKEEAESTTTPITTVGINKDTGLPDGNFQTKRRQDGVTENVEGRESGIKGEAKSKKLKETPKDKADAKARVEGQQQESNEEALTASATCDGDYRLIAKTTVFTTGRLSKRWRNMKWYIKSVNHKINQDGYTCELDLTAPPKVDAEDTKNKALKKEQGIDIDDIVERKREIDPDTGLGGNFITIVKDGKTGKIKRVIKD